MDPVTGRGMEVPTHWPFEDRAWSVPVTVLPSTLRLPPKDDSRAEAVAEELNCQFPEAWAKAVEVEAVEVVCVLQPESRPARRPARPSEVTAKMRRGVPEERAVLWGRDGRFGAGAGEGIGVSTFRSLDDNSRDSPGR